jgi:hypothetical protein
MRYRIPADPRRKEIRKRAQAALLRRAMPRTLSRTIRVQTVCSVTHGTPLFRRAICVQCRAWSAVLRRAIRSQCRAQLAALPLRSLCVQCRAQLAALPPRNLVRNVAHKLCALSRTVFCRAICAQCRAQPAAQCSASSRTIGCRCNLPPIPALSQPPLAAMPQLSEKPHLGFATKKTAWNPGTERLQLHSDTRVASCGG